MYMMAIQNQITFLIKRYDTLYDICLGSWTLDLNGDVFFSGGH